MSQELTRAFFHHSILKEKAEQDSAKGRVEDGEVRTRRSQSVQNKGDYLSWITMHALGHELSLGGK